MSRKVTLTVPVDIVVRDWDVHVLPLVKKRSGASSHGVSASIRSFADGLNVSLYTARRALASCEEAGYLTVRANRVEHRCACARSCKLWYRVQRRLFL